MLIMSVNSKRQRRPNVRLGEIGDISAAWACGFSQNTREKLDDKTWKEDVDEESNSLYGYFGLSSPEFSVSEFSVPPQIFAELHQNKENNNLNSSELAVEPEISAELLDLTKSKLDFTNVTRKCRDMKRRGRGRNDGYSLSIEEKEYAETHKAGCTSNLHENHLSPDGFNEFQDHHQSPTRSKEASEYDMKHNVQFNSEKESDVNGVGEWLEEAGFGRYASLFVMHEVDEEALPLLTVEDLKEMGISSVGPRRKLYNAIQQLKGEEE